MYILLHIPDSFSCTDSFFFLQFTCSRYSEFYGKGYANIIISELTVKFSLVQIWHWMPSILIIHSRFWIPLGYLVSFMWLVISAPRKDMRQLYMKGCF